MYWHGWHQGEMARVLTALETIWGRVHFFLFLFVLQFPRNQMQTKSGLKIWQQLQLVIVIFIAAPVFICEFLTNIQQEKMPIKHNSGRVALKSTIGIF